MWRTHGSRTPSSGPLAQRLNPTSRRVDLASVRMCSRAIALFGNAIDPECVHDMRNCGNAHLRNCPSPCITGGGTAVRVLEPSWTPSDRSGKPRYQPLNGWGQPAALSPSHGPPAEPGERVAFTRITRLGRFSTNSSCVPHKRMRMKADPFLLAAHRQWCVAAPLT